MASDFSLAVSPSGSASASSAFQLTADQQAAHDLLLHRLTRAGPALPEASVSVLTGPAGTGKTTLMRALLASLEAQRLKVMLMAPTGKAAARLKQLTGAAETRTIHGWIFKGGKTVGICPSCARPAESLGLSVAEAIQRNLSSISCSLCYASFSVPVDIRAIERTLAFNQGEEQTNRKAVVIVDEASMVSKKLYRDIMAAAGPQWRFLFVGDREQLQPVVMEKEHAGWGVDFDRPHATLTQVLRQAAGNPIIRHATRIRTGALGTGFWDLPEDDDADPRLQSLFCRTWDAIVGRYVRHRLAKKADGSWDTDQQSVVMLTYVNSLRRLLNTSIRQRLTLPNGMSLAHAATILGTPFVPGDRILVTANNNGVGVMNGEVFSVADAYYVDQAARDFGLVCVDVWTEGDNRLTFWVRAQAVGLSSTTHRLAEFPLRMRVQELDDQLHKLWAVGDRTDWHPALYEIPPRRLWELGRVVLPTGLVQCDYGDCISVVKSQGSQWKHVLIAWDRTSQFIAEKDPDQGRRLAYTALTRAQESACIYVSRQYSPKDQQKADEKTIADFPECAPEWVNAFPPETDTLKAAKAILAEWQLTQAPEEDNSECQQEAVWD